MGMVHVHDLLAKPVQFELLTPHGDGSQVNTGRMVIHVLLLTPHGDGSPRGHELRRLHGGLLTPHGDGSLGSTGVRPAIGIVS